MDKKIRVGIIFGGQSPEHEVSIQSAKNIVAALDKNKYETVLIYIGKNGQWFLNDSPKALLETSIKDETNKFLQKSFSITDTNSSKNIDVIFPILHGPFGEDGTIQGLLKLMNLPFVGPSVLSSAVGMDKDVCKRLLQQAKIPIAKFMVFRAGKKIDFKKIKTKLGLPLFVKPANLGSSVGVSKVKSEQEFKTGVEEAFKYDNKILIEEFIKGREVECSVLGNEDPIASVPGEIIPTHEFYSYDAKYLDQNGAILKIPADLPIEIIKKVQRLAITTYKTLCAEGMSRVDMFLTDSGKVYVNEINTIPGFTKISMYPKLWEASGITYSQLLDKLINLAIDRFNKEKCLNSL